jgi:hypothetical protein
MEKLSYKEWKAALISQLNALNEVMNKQTGTFVCS